jgi:hypothetical protein
LDKPAAVAVVRESCLRVPWKVAGAGNLTCKAAVNAANASKGVARVPLDQFTDDYLRKKIDSVCNDNSNQNVNMVVVVFELLGAQPLVR